MPAFRCSLCGINFPSHRPCPVCAGPTAAFYNEQPDPDWEEAVERALAQREDVGYQRLVAHRTVRLLDLGFSLAQIELLPLNRPDIAHDAERLLTRGAPHEYVVHELREDDFAVQANEGEES